MSNRVFLEIVNSPTLTTHNFFLLLPNSKTVLFPKLSTVSSDQLSSCDFVSTSTSSVRFPQSASHVSKTDMASLEA